MANKTPDSELVNLYEFVAGGLVGDIDARFTNSRFEMWNYDGKSPKPSCVLRVDLVNLADEAADAVEQVWSVSSSSPPAFLPVNEGRSLKRAGTATTLIGSSNYALLLESLAKYAFDTSRLGMDIGNLNGLEAHVIRQAAPPRAGMEHREGEREKTVLVVSAIHKMPWEAKAKTKAKPGTKPKTPANSGAAASAAAGAEAEAPGDEETGKKHLVPIVTDKGVIARGKLKALVFRAMTDEDAETRESVMSGIDNDAWLASIGLAAQGDNIMVAE